MWLFGKLTGNEDKLRVSTFNLKNHFSSSKFIIIFAL